MLTLPAYSDGQFAADDQDGIRGLLAGQTIRCTNAPELTGVMINAESLVKN